MAISPTKLPLIPSAPLTVTATPTAAMSGHRVVRADGMYGRVRLADNRNIEDSLAVMGISCNAASPSDKATIQYYGELIEPSWNWVANAPIYCGQEGQLTQIPPTHGFILIVGIAVSTTSMMIGIKQPILLTI